MDSQNNVCRQIAWWTFWARLCTDMIWRQSRDIKFPSTHQCDSAACRTQLSIMTFHPIFTRSNNGIKPRVTVFFTALDQVEHSGKKAGRHCGIVARTRASDLSHTIFQGLLNCRLSLSVHFIADLRDLNQHALNGNFGYNVSIKDASTVVSISTYVSVFFVL